MIAHKELSLSNHASVNDNKLNRAEFNFFRDRFALDWFRIKWIP
ncbi:hypothetical protein TBK1r_10520 [Stieleria magnilauensis]|uniref:Uncharacterized protein n=1 Tax=Stieleria magnilauensis TaxID=2527963 RepID=A0ABX5XK97_9BACT|nr:hypothetical protein TBK1r_10520 [Planctomycetes bacterium TBK1r]